MKQKAFFCSSQVPNLKYQLLPIGIPDSQSCKEIRINFPRIKLVFPQPNENTYLKETI